MHSVAALDSRVCTAYVHGSPFCLGIKGMHRHRPATDPLLQGFYFTLFLKERPKEGTRSHLWATMWFLGIELRTSGRTASALNRCAVSVC